MCHIDDCIVCYAVGLREITRWWTRFTWIEVNERGKPVVVWYDVT